MAAADLPVDVLSVMVKFGGHAELLRLQSAWRQMKRVIEEHEVELWSLLILATWPIEGPVLVSLGEPRSMFRAFLQRRPARSNIRALSCETNDESSLFFLARVGEFAGEARWYAHDGLPSDVAQESLYWRPTARETKFDFGKPVGCSRWEEPGSDGPTC